jgi:nucleoside-diphosphate-sugar epimerase
MSAHGICAVTGATGYVGGKIKSHLGRAGWTVSSWTRRPPGKSDVKFQLGDDVDPNLFAGTKALVHCAYDFGLRSWDDIATINIRGAEKILRAARTAGVQHIVFISSISAFEGCRALYGKAKMEIETVARSVNAFVIRPGLVYGDQAGGVFGGLVNQTRAGIIPLIGGGRQLQFLVHDEDLGQFVGRCITGGFPPPAGPITLANEQGWTMRGLLEELARAQGKRPKLIPVPWPLVWFGLKSLEVLHLPAPFRSDSLISLVCQNPAPSFDLAKSVGAQCRPFRVTPGMFS